MSKVSRFVKNYSEFLLQLVINGIYFTSCYRDLSYFQVTVTLIYPGLVFTSGFMNSSKNMISSYYCFSYWAKHSLYSQSLIHSHSQLFWLSSIFNLHYNAPLSWMDINLVFRHPGFNISQFCVYQILVLPKEEIMVRLSNIVSLKIKTTSWGPLNLKWFISLWPISVIFFIINIR